MDAQSARIDDLAREKFGYAELRPGQREAVESVLAGRDTLAVMSTGSGKSAIYQLAGLMLEGPTIVVSPLIALQRDQVENLEESVGGAAAVSSQVSASEAEEALEEVQEHELEFLFLAPEQLTKPEVLEDLRAARPSLFVVDEAHCISEWGHDFRPDYLKLGAVAEEIGRPTILALTATASPPVREEIVERLHMREPAILVRGFDRDNIWLGVERHYTERKKHDAIIEAVRRAEKPGIVYGATRKGVERLAETLTHAGVNAVAYHGSLATKKRNAIQEAFMNDEADVIVATTAFGMGVDKPNVRFVFHSEIADSVDSYYQEIGRAGRDGHPARALLFYRQEDLGLRRFFAGAGKVDEEQIELVAEALVEHDGPMPATELKEETELSDSKLVTAVSRLEDVGAVEVLPSGEIEETPEARRDTEAAVEEAAAAQREREQFDRSLVEMMRGYAELSTCRRAYILNYFGQDYEPPCGNCENCDEGHGVAEGREPFPMGSRVCHATWGEGTVNRYEDSQMVVLFDSVGYKTLGVDLVLERGLLEAAEA